MQQAGWALQYGNLDLVNEAHPHRFILPNAYQLMHNKLSLSYVMYQQYIAELVPVQLPFYDKFTFYSFLHFSNFETTERMISQRLRAQKYIWVGL